MTLTIRASEPGNVFSLNGTDENSGTFAIGWALKHSPQFRDAMTEACFGPSVDASNAVISLQKHGPDGGYTDLEFQPDRGYHAILEAKRWWSVPSQTQLSRYRPRLSASGAQHTRLVTVSSADSGFASRRLPSHIGSVPVIHLSWGDIQKLAKRARANASGFEEKLWLRHLILHLREFVAMDRLTNNMVYVVSLGIQNMVSGGSHTWIDVVEKDECYFHPIKGGWPNPPPNYMGFRYGGKLQSVHHVDVFDVIQDLSKFNPLWPKTTADHFVYRLGPAMKPALEIRTGKIFRNSRVHCAIDTLLSGAFETISDARNETKRRLAAA